MSVVPKDSASDGIDLSKVDDAVLALLWLNLSATGTAWKSMDWETMERLHDRGLISDPVGKRKSVDLTAEGRREAERMFRSLFSRR